MRIIDLIKTFFTAKPFLSMDVRVVFQFGTPITKTFTGVEHAGLVCGDEKANKVEFDETGLTFFVSENDESW